MKHMQEAIQLHLEGMKEEGLDIPESSSEALTVSV
jgi:predicted RNase H-like HicB family nuclease